MYVHVCTYAAWCATAQCFLVVSLGTLQSACIDTFSCLLWRLVPAPRNYMYASHTYIRVFDRYARTHMCVRMYVRMYVGMYVCVYILYVCTYMHAHVHTKQHEAFVAMHAGPGSLLRSIKRRIPPDVHTWTLHCAGLCVAHFPHRHQAQPFSPLVGPCSKQHFHLAG